VADRVGGRIAQDYRDILPDARKVTSPALYVGAKDGPEGKAVNSRIVDFVEQQLPS
jgi:hypothetical protein